MDNSDMTPAVPERKPVFTTRNGSVFTNSRDVAAFFEKDHKHVIRDIEKLIAGGVPNFGLTPYTHEQNGQEYKSYDMNRDGFAILAMGFTGAKALKWKLSYIAGFNMMEEQLRSAPAVDPAAILNDPAALRGLLLENVEKVLSLQAEVAAMTPKTEALARLAEADGSMCFTDAAKTLQQRPKDLIQKMRTGWIYSRQGGGYIAYQDKIQRGYLEHKTTTVSRQDGTEKVVTQVRVTPKGLVKLAEELGQH